MAQPNPPTEEQLHLKRNGDEESDSGYLSQHGTLGSQPSSMTTGRSGSSSSIIDEQKLLALLPRFREPATANTLVSTTVGTPSTTESTTVSTTTISTTTTAETTTTPQPTTTTTESTSKPMKDSKTTKNPAIALKERLDRNRQKHLNLTAAPPIQEHKFTIRMKNLEENGNDNSTVVDVSAGKNITTTSMEQETEELITEIEKVLTEGEGWIMTDSENKTIATTASAVISTAVTIKNKMIHKEEDQSIEGSGEHEEESSEEDSDSSESSEPVERKVASKSIATTKLGSSTSTFATTKSSNTTVSTTTVPQKFRNPFKKKSANTDGNIPEAEEDEQAGDIAQLQLDSSTVSSMGQNVFNVNSNANSNSHPEIANVITPVNSIIDGIGPLILPLIGYGRQAVAAYYPRRVEGVPVYRPDYSPAPVSYKSTMDQQMASPYTQVPYPQREAIPAQSTAPQQIHSHNDGLPVRTHSFPTFTASPANIQHRAMHSPQVEAQAVRDFKHYPEDINRGTYYQTPNLGDRLVMAETVAASRISQNTANNKQEGSTTFPADAIRRALANMLQRENRDREPATVREINGSNRQNGELPYYPPEIGQHIKSHNSLSEGADSSNAKTKESQKPNIDDPGYDLGRSNVVNTFYSDSGLMVQDANTKPTAPEQQSAFVAASEIRRSEPAQKSSSFSPTVQGFGGGRRPDVSFEDVAKS
ncbi:hypothetical protein Ddc_00849 [Ditylenchus destructor]|nr:hypothetical protein Ddc_00849 [Ditylenchus destructor]